MPFTTVAWNESQDTGGVLTDVAFQPDAHVMYAGDLMTVPTEVAMLAGAYAIGDTITMARLVSPSLRALIPPDIAPLDDNEVPTEPIPFIDWFDNPIPLVPSEQLGAQVAEAASGAEREIVGVWLIDRAVTPYRGPFSTVRGTNAVALAANAWSARVMTLDSVLPAGTYSLVGLKVASTTNILSRCIFPGGAWRPGVIGSASAAIVEPLRFRFGNAGVFGTFKHDQPPQIEHLATSTDSTSECWMDLVKTA